MVNSDTPSVPSRHDRARQLIEQAVDAERNGDLETADQLLAGAQRTEPQAVKDVLHEYKDDLAARSHLWHYATPISTEPATDFDITLTVNETVRHVRVDARTTLLDALRDRLHLTGTKRGCDLGQCGACTVLMNGRRINACLALAVMAHNKSITTIEGLGKNGELCPMQRAFIEHDAFQCGYCTPGQIVSAVGLIIERRAGTDASIRENMSGNICRCGAYTNIISAIREVVGRAT